jgi:hypothetical protein
MLLTHRSENKCGTTQVETGVEFTLGETLRVIPWHDSALERFGFTADSDYAELFWLPTLGPSALWLLRRVNRLLEVSPSGITLDTELLGTMLGLRFTKPKDSLVERTVKRCIYFSVAKATESQTLAFRTALGPISTRQLQRLPSELQSLHLKYSNNNVRVHTIREELHARRMAATLAQAGVSKEEIPAELEKLKFESTVARRATNGIP